jgi:hypothetical protein
MMRSDSSLDKDIKNLEQRIAERRVELRDSIDDLAQQARIAKQRVRNKATSPVVWGGALVLGFVAARLARSARHRRAPPRNAWMNLRTGRVEKEKPVSPTRQAVAAVLSAAVPIALRVAQHSAGPWIARAVQSAQQKQARRSYERSAYGRY